MLWSAKFEYPIVLPDGRKLLTLRDAGEYIQALPIAVQQRKEWQAAAQALVMVLDSGAPTTTARIGMMQALYPEKLDRPGPGRNRARAYKIVRS